MESAAASAFLKSVMGKLFQVLEKEYNKQKSLRQETLSIQQDLRMIAAAMDDRLHALGSGQHRTAVARLYSEEMLGLAHDAQDCIDRIVHRLTCRPSRGSGGGASPSALVRRVVHELKKVQSRSGFADEIHKLKARLKLAHERVVGIPIAAAACQESSASSWSCRVARNPLGIGKTVEELLSLLDEVEGEPEQLRVISIVGFGGLGKTTLARAVYESPPATENFDCRAWVAAGRWSPEVTGDWVSEILRDVLGQVLPKDAMDDDYVDKQRLESFLKEYLKDTRYLIVIDDIAMEQWSAMNSIFGDHGKGSRIILTTTIQRTAKMCSHGSGYVYQLNTLGEEDSMDIALQGVVRSPELEQGSTLLLQKCGGLPLALVSVSDFLKSANEPTGELCSKLCRNLGSHLREKHDNDNFTELRKVLMHNYDSLSVYDMTCLLYLGVFPSNRPLKKKVLIRRWIAEGYAQSDSLDSEEDIADETFKMLLDRNIIQSIDTRSNAQVKTCRTHGIMHEFLRHKSMSQGFVATSSPDHPRSCAYVNNFCHLSIHGGSVTDSEASDENLSRVRSLTVFGKAGDVISYVRKCKLLRVLDLEECKYDIRSLKLYGKLSRLPPFVTLLTGLTELSISSASLTRDLLSSLINLGNLLYLKLIVDQLENFEMIKGAFPSLRRLCFVVRSLASPLPVIEQGALPNLVSLQLLCPGLVGLSGIQIRHLKHLKEVMVDCGVTEQTRKDWEQAAKNHPNRPRLSLLKSGDPVESKGPGHEEASVVREKRKLCVVQPSLDDGLDSSLKKMKLSSESSSQLQVMVHSTSSSGR